MISIIFDTETTGLIKPGASDIKDQPYITEIYCSKVQILKEELVVMDTFHRLVKPPIPITEEITRITGITNEQLASEKTFPEIRKDLSEFFTGADTMVAHNLPFDRSMLANELLRCGKVLNFPWPVNHVCTVEKTLHIEQRRMSLQNLHIHLFGKGFENAHRANIDVEALSRCYEELVKTGVIQ